MTWDGADRGGTYQLLVHIRAQMRSKDLREELRDGTLASGYSWKKQLGEKIPD